MGVDVPELDDRTYEEFLADARKRIPTVAEEWTDHNAHDPGITFLELFAWLAEAHNYRLDRMTDRHRSAYLRLLGVTPEPPRRAAAPLRVEPAPDLAGETIAEGTRMIAERTSGEADREIPFTTDADVTLSGTSIAAVYRETPDGVVERTDENETPGTYFRAFGRHAFADSACYVGFDDDPFRDPTSPFSLWVDFHEENLPNPAEHGDEDPEFEPSVQLAWEYCTDYEAWNRDAAWKPLEVVADGTDSLYHGGTVMLAHPEPGRWRGTDRFGVAGAEPGLAWLRVRVEHAGYEIPPQIDQFRTNVVPVTHGSRAGPERLTGPDGTEVTNAQPGQRFKFDRAPVRSATVKVGDECWEPVPSLDGSGPDDHHYVLEVESGAVRFGDNVRGAVPEAGQSVVATRYEFGGGPEGNVGSNAAWRVDPREDGGAAGGAASNTGDEGSAGASGGAGDGDLTEAQLRGMTVDALAEPAGGRAAESVNEALARLAAELEVPYRCVTAADFEYVATHTPGLRFGRAKAFTSSVESGSDCADRDAVQVVIVPYGTTDRPTPSNGFLDAVDCHLQRHRLVTDRVEAVPPTYVGIGVRTVVRLHDGYTVAGRTGSIEEALDTFLSPLSGYDGRGWPFGRPVYRPELSEAISSVEGVDCVHDVAVDVDGEAERIEESVRIDPTALVYPTEHAVSVSEEPRTCGEVRR